MERPEPSSIPVTPGVYLYRDAQGKIIYVGKARNLRRRIFSYFRPRDQLTPKTAAMIGHAVSLETLNTTTEKEALLLEASLIKKHRAALQYRPAGRQAVRPVPSGRTGRVPPSGSGAQGAQTRRRALLRAVYVRSGRARDLEEHTPHFSSAPLLKSGHEKPGASLSVSSYRSVPCALLRRGGQKGIRGHDPPSFSSAGRKVEGAARHASREHGKGLGRSGL